MKELAQIFINGQDAGYLIVFIMSILITLVTGPVLIPWLHKLKFGQQILEDGPKWHEKKNGTPTMGGIMFIIATVVSVVVAILIKRNIKLLIMLLVTLGFGLIGFIDDYVKVVKKRNMVLTAAHKFLLQAFLSLAYIFVLKLSGNLTSEIIIPFVEKTIIMPWWLYFVFIMFVVCGTVNAVNLTDGLDGLAASITVIVSLFFVLAAIMVGDNAAGYLAIAVAGGCIGFLRFNKYPAKVFMGDTGSLFLGGAISVLAVGLQMPLILVIAGFVYLFETLSVILQVASFKLTGKRIFKMSPIHHHFEMCGWSEKKIVGVFSVVTLILCIIAFFAIIPVVIK